MLSCRQFAPDGNGGFRQEPWHSNKYVNYYNNNSLKSLQLNIAHTIQNARLSTPHHLQEPRADLFILLRSNGDFGPKNVSGKFTGLTVMQLQIPLEERQ